LSLEGVNLSVPGKHILRDVSVQLQAGEVLALLGPSGCGKTSLLRGIAGLQDWDSGRLSLHGQDMGGVPVQSRGVGMVFQHYALFPQMDVRANVGFGLQGLPSERRRARVDELLQLVGLTELAGRKPHELSGGQRQRVALARALAPQPSVLLLDEPFSALDEQFRRPLRRAFRQLQRGLRQTCVLVTHDREEAFELADQVAVMKDGCILQQDSPAALLAQPATEEVASFLGCFNLWTRLSDGARLATPLRSLSLEVDAAVEALPAHGVLDEAQGGDAGWVSGRARVTDIAWSAQHWRVSLESVQGEGVLADGLQAFWPADAAPPVLDGLVRWRQPVTAMRAFGG
jgi:ABC-type Fe3+/spermidine/putrescine transport system ATPase subunit